MFRNKMRSGTRYFYKSHEFQAQNFTDITMLGKLFAAQILARYAKADQSFPFIRTHQYIEVIAIP